MSMKVMTPTKAAKSMPNSHRHRQCIPTSMSADFCSATSQLEVKIDDSEDAYKSLTESTISEKSSSTVPNLLPQSRCTCCCQCKAVSSPVSATVPAKLKAAIEDNLPANISAVDAAKDENGLSAVHHAASQGTPEVLCALLTSGASPHLRDTRGMRPLHYSSAGGHVTACESLLVWGAEVNAQSLEGYTGLHLAAANGHTDVVELLLQYQANPSLVNIEGKTPLDLACVYAKYNVINLLQTKAAHQAVKLQHCHSNMVNKQPQQPCNNQQTPSNHNNQHNNHCQPHQIPPHDHHGNNVHQCPSNQGIPHGNHVVHQCPSTHGNQGNVHNNHPQPHPQQHYPGHYQQTHHQNQQKVVSSSGQTYPNPKDQQSHSNNPVYNNQVQNNRPALRHPPGTPQHQAMTSHNSPRHSPFHHPSSTPPQQHATVNSPRHVPVPLTSGTYHSQSSHSTPSYVPPPPNQPPMVPNQAQPFQPQPQATPLHHRRVQSAHQYANDHSPTDTSSAPHPLPPFDPRLCTQGVQNLLTVNSVASINATEELRQNLKEACFAVQAKAISSYSDPNNSDRISFQAGDLITVLREAPAGGLWKGFVTAEGVSKTGFFPGCHVTLLSQRRQCEIPPNTGQMGNNQHQPLKPNMSEKELQVDHSGDDQLFDDNESASGDESGSETGSSDEEECCTRENCDNCVEDNSSEGSPILLPPKMEIKPAVQWDPTPLTNNSSGMGQPIRCDKWMMSACVPPLQQQTSTDRHSVVSADSGRSSCCTTSCPQSTNRTSGGPLYSTAPLSPSDSGAGASTCSSSCNCHIPPPNTLSSQPISDLPPTSLSPCSAPIGPAGIHQPATSPCCCCRCSSSMSMLSLDAGRSSLSMCSSEGGGGGGGGKISVESEMMVHWLHSIGMPSYCECLLRAGYDLATLSRATPEDLNAGGVTNPKDRKTLKTELSRLSVPDNLPDHIPESVSQWLKLLKMEEYQDTLHNQGYTSMDQMMQLTWEDLEDIGIDKLGHQKKLSLALERLNRLKSSASSTWDRNRRTNNPASSANTTPAHSNQPNNRSSHHSNRSGDPSNCISPPVSPAQPPNSEVAQMTNSRTTDVTNQPNEMDKMPNRGGPFFSSTSGSSRPQLPVGIVEPLQHSLEQPQTPTPSRGGLAPPPPRRTSSMQAPGMDSPSLQRHEMDPAKQLITSSTSSSGTDSSSLSIERSANQKCCNCSANQNRSGHHHLPFANENIGTIRSRLPDEKGRLYDSPSASNSSLGSK